MLKKLGKPPRTLGPVNGRLEPYPDKPKCLASQTETDRPGDTGPHHVRPFKYSGRAADAMTRLLAVLLAAPHCRIVAQTAQYLYAQFEMPQLGGTITDMEFLVSPDEEVIHVRSACRIGLLDFGTTRARIEELRVAFDEAD